LFFLIVIIIGAFFIVNLITAIQFFYYNRLKIDKEKEKAIIAREKAK